MKIKVVCRKQIIVRITNGLSRALDGDEQYSWFVE